MNEIESYPSSKNLTKQGVTAVFSLSAGIALFIMNAVGIRFPLAGLVLGGVTALVGIFALLSRDPSDRKPGLVLALAGALMLLARAKIPLLTAAAGTLLGIGAVGFIALGIWNGVKFIMGLKRRS
ncbi:MAG: hypothetical protein LBI86_04000 [Treponema sp.]|jgi:hypothetical protein|nr:hypothetical protein [Treponema sp.]